MRAGFTIGFGHFGRSILRNSTPAIVSELRALAPVSDRVLNQFAFMPGLPELPAGSQILGFATKLEMGAEEAINNSLYVKPFGWGQLGGAGSIGAGIHGLKQAYGMLSYTSSILNQQIKKTIEHLPAGHKADFYANLGVTEIHSIDVNPDYDGILLNSYMGHLDPENEIRTVRFALLELEAGNFEGAKRDLATALRNLRKYGSVTVNGSVQIDGSFAF